MNSVVNDAGEIPNKLLCLKKVVFISTIIVLILIVNIEVRDFPNPLWQGSVVHGPQAIILFLEERFYWNTAMPICLCTSVSAFLLP